MPHTRSRTYRYENLIKKNKGQMNAKVRKYANIRQAHTRIKIKVCKQTQLNETKTIANEEATKRNSRACSLKPKQKQTKANTQGLISLKDRAAQASTRPYERMEAQVGEPNVTSYISPKNLLIDVSIEGFKNM